MVKVDGSFKQMLVKVDRPILRIPTLAVHLDRQDPFSFNKETQLFPIAGLIAAELNRHGTGGGNGREKKQHGAESTPMKALSEFNQRHHPYLIEIIAEEASVHPYDIVDFELVLYDTQKSCVVGDFP